MFEADTVLARGAATSEALEIGPAPASGRAAEEDPLELTLIDAVLAACELSDDQTEVRDLVDAMVRRPDVRVVAEARPTAWARALDGIRHMHA